MVRLKAEFAFAGASSKVKKSDLARGLTTETLKSSKIWSAANRAAVKTNSACVMPQDLAARSIRLRSSVGTRRCNVASGFLLELDLEAAVFMGGALGQWAAN
jgi:hypothetical protein